MATRQEAFPGRQREFAAVLRNFDSTERKKTPLSVPVVARPVSQERPSTGDEILDRLGGSFEDMSDEEFLGYFATRYKQANGIDLGGMKAKNLAIVQKFRRRYPEAGEMMQFFFDEWKGQVRGEPRGIEAFAENNSWMTNPLLMALRERRQKIAKKQVAPKKLLNRMSQWINE